MSFTAQLPGVPQGDYGSFRIWGIEIVFASHVLDQAPQVSCSRCIIGYCPKPSRQCHSKPLGILETCLVSHVVSRA